MKELNLKTKNKWMSKFLIMGAVALLMSLMCLFATANADETDNETASDDGAAIDIVQVDVDATETESVKEEVADTEESAKEQATSEDADTEENETSSTETNSDEINVDVQKLEDTQNGATYSCHYIDSAGNNIVGLSVKAQLWKFSYPIQIIETKYGVTDANGSVVINFTNESTGLEFSISVQDEESQGYWGSSSTGGIIAAKKIYKVVVNTNGGKITEGTPAETHAWTDNGDGTWSTTAYESNGDTVDTVLADWANVKIVRNGVAQTSFQPNSGSLHHDFANKNFTTNITAYFGDEPAPEPTPTPQTDSTSTGSTVSSASSLAQTGDVAPIATLCVVLLACGVTFVASKKKILK